MKETESEIRKRWRVQWQSSAGVIGWRMVDGRSVSDVGCSKGSKVRRRRLNVFY